MEAIGRRNGFWYGENCCLASLFPKPPTAVERFSNYNQSQYLLASNKENGGYDYSSNNGAFGAAESGESRVDNFQAEVGSFEDRIFVDVEESQNRGSVDGKRKFGKVDKCGTPSSTSHAACRLTKDQWGPKEDGTLIQLVEQLGEGKWAMIAKLLPGRKGKQCRERWHNHLRPDIKKDGWSEEEEMLLVEEHRKIGNRWATIAKKIPGRSENAIKNHWNATKRRQDSRARKPSAANGRPQPPGVLQTYIRSLALGIAPQKGDVASGSSDLFEDGSLSAIEDFYPDAQMVLHDGHAEFMQALLSKNNRALPDTKKEGVKEEEAMPSHQNCELLPHMPRPKENEGWDYYNSTNDLLEKEIMDLIDNFC